MYACTGTRIQNVVGSAARAHMCSRAGRPSAARLWMQSRAAAADLRTPALGRQIRWLTLGWIYFVSELEIHSPCLVRPEHPVLEFSPPLFAIFFKNNINRPTLPPTGREPCGFFPPALSLLPPVAAWVRASSHALWPPTRVRDLPLHPGAAACPTASSPGPARYRLSSSIICSAWTSSARQRQ